MSRDRNDLQGSAQLEAAKEFIKSVNLQGVPTSPLKAPRSVSAVQPSPVEALESAPGVESSSFKALESAPAFQPTDNENQSAVVGSQIISYTAGVPSRRRTTLMESALLAQFLANQNVPNTGNSDQWFNEDYDALTNMGWLVGGRSQQKFEATSAQMDVHAAVLNIVAGLSSAAPVLQLIRTTLDALRQPNTPWITLFQSASVHTTAARFQMSVHEQDDSAFIPLMGFDLEASSTVTQVLLFKFAEERATLRQSSGDVAILWSILDGIAGEIHNKVAGFTQGWVQSINLKTPPPHA